MPDSHHWRIVRIEPNGTGLGLGIGPTDSVDVTVTLQDTITGAYSAWQGPWSQDAGAECTNLAQLHAAGFTPADWDTECGF